MFTLRKIMFMSDPGDSISAYLYHNAEFCFNLQEIFSNLLLYSCDFNDTAYEFEIVGWHLAITVEHFVFRNYGEGKDVTEIANIFRCALQEDLEVYRRLKQTGNAQYYCMPLYLGRNEKNLGEIKAMYAVTNFYLNLSYMKRLVIPTTIKRPYDPTAVIAFSTMQQEIWKAFEEELKKGMVDEEYGRYDKYGDIFNNVEDFKYFIKIRRNYGCGTFGTDSFFWKEVGSTVEISVMSDTLNLARPFDDFWHKFDELLSEQKPIKCGYVGKQYNAMCYYTKTEKPILMYTRGKETKGYDNVILYYNGREYTSYGSDIDGKRVYSGESRATIYQSEVTYEEFLDTLYAITQKDRDYVAFLPFELLNLILNFPSLLRKNKLEKVVEVLTSYMGGGMSAYIADNWKRQIVNNQLGFFCGSLRLTPDGIELINRWFNGKLKVLQSDDGVFISPDYSVGLKNDSEFANEFYRLLFLYPTGIRSNYPYFSTVISALDVFRTDKMRVARLGDTVASWSGFGVLDQKFMDEHSVGEIQIRGMLPKVFYSMLDADTVGMLNLIDLQSVICTSAEVNVDGKVQKFNRNVLVWSALLYWYMIYRVGKEAESSSVAEFVDKVIMSDIVALYTAMEGFLAKFGKFMEEFVKKDVGADMKAFVVAFADAYGAFTAIEPQFAYALGAKCLLSSTPEG